MRDWQDTYQKRQKQCRSLTYTIYLLWSFLSYNACKGYAGNNMSLINNTRLIFYNNLLTGQEASVHCSH